MSDGDKPASLGSPLVVRVSPHIRFKGNTADRGSEKKFRRNSKLKGASTICFYGNTGTDWHRSKSENLACETNLIGTGSE
jgi:hypothetical protein